jgi:hypothetical protein
MSLYSIKNIRDDNTIFDNRESVLYSLNVEEDRVVVIERIPSNSANLTLPPQPVPDQAVKHIFRVKDGKLSLEETKVGVITPSKVIVEQEQIVFND